MKCHEQTICVDSRALTAIVASRGVNVFFFLLNLDSPHVRETWCPRQYLGCVNKYGVYGIKYIKIVSWNGWELWQT